MSAASLSLGNRPMLLSELFEAAGIFEYADWSSNVRVCPAGNPAYRPRPYQISGLNHVAAFLPRAAIYDDPGVGKSLQLQALMLWLAGVGNKAIAVMPPALVRQFEVSLHATYPEAYRYLKVGVIDGERSIRQKQIDQFEKEGWPEILILSYPTFLGKEKAAQRRKLTAKQEKGLAKLPEEEALARRLELATQLRLAFEEENKLYRWTPRTPITAYNLRAESLHHLGYNVLVPDEAHKLKNHTSALHAAVRDFVCPWKGDNSEGLILATGSPIETNVEDAFGLINLIDPKRYGSKRAFDAKHCVLMPDVPYRKVIAYQNLDYLYQGLYARGRRISKKQAFPDMPPRVITELQVDLSPDHKTFYDKLVEERVIEMEDRLIDATAEQRLYQYMQQVLLVPEKFAGKSFKSNAMLDAVDSLLDQLGSRKVLLFAWYQDSIAKLAEHYKAFNPAVLNGGVTGAAREKAKQRFIQDPDCRLFIANPQSGGVGIDGFQHVCTYAVFVEVCPWVGRWEQAIGRLERGGQTEAVNIYLIVPKGTIATKLRNDLVRGEANANDVVRDTKTLMRDLMGKQGIQGVIT